MSILDEIDKKMNKFREKLLRDFDVNNTITTEEFFAGSSMCNAWAKFYEMVRVGSLIVIEPYEISEGICMYEYNPETHEFTIQGTRVEAGNP